MIVEVGFTVVDPKSVLVLKLPGVIATELAFVMFQERVEVPFRATTPGDAVKAVMEGVAVPVKLAVRVILLFTVTVSGFVVVLILPDHEEKA